MRSDPADYLLVAPQSLHDAVALLASEPGAWLPPSPANGRRSRAARM